MSSKTIKGAMIAGAVASMFAAGQAFAAATGAAANVKCSGLNACKGAGACGGAGNSCKGQNACKGKGITMTASEKDCTDKKGKVIAAAPAAADDKKAK
jgi:hypothetical protein